MSEKRVFEGRLCNPDEKWYLDDDKTTGPDEWFNGLWNWRVRITIEPLPVAPEFAVSDELQPEWKKDWPECHCFHDVCCGLLNPKENAKCRKCKWSKPESAPGPGASDSNGGGA